MEMWEVGYGIYSLTKYLKIDERLPGLQNLL